MGEIDTNIGVEGKAERYDLAHAYLDGLGIPRADERFGQYPYAVPKRIKFIVQDALDARLELNRALDKAKVASRSARRYADEAAGYKRQRDELQKAQKSAASETAAIKALQECEGELQEARTGSDELTTAVRSLCNNLSDWAIDLSRECIGNTNAAAIVHWRDRVLTLLGDDDATP